MSDPRFWLSPSMLADEEERVSLSKAEFKRLQQVQEERDEYAEWVAALYEVVGGRQAGMSLVELVRERYDAVVRINKGFQDEVSAREKEGEGLRLATRLLIHAAEVRLDDHGDHARRALEMAITEARAALSPRMDGEAGE